ncbi:gliding motility lipoprotein GldK [Cellulophaga sp. F20128]|uniref:type IX secretion system lipoprotein PorK/GldK n=1 Tax=Cellulophaga sp. F20128 TaxID=2926413 RepID=UPI001FF3EDB8|nr:gliding motility lipoprotein GldK [Cellulophaga sp. F20128]MCK0157322.1 gliding motility lipoprotein GldK [Cellulophaga sp. F20128]
MKKLLLLSMGFVFLLSSCGKSGAKGELVGAQGKKWYPEKPYGMELIPRGSFIMGKSEEDQAQALNAPTKTVTVTSFYMDDTEITNSEYRQFVDWVKDSITRTKLAILADELGLSPEDGGIGDFAFKDADTTKMSEYDKYMLDNYSGGGPTGYEGRALNRDESLVWDTSEYPDEYYVEVMDKLYIPEAEAYNGQRTIDVTQLVYKYSWMDIEAAARAKGKGSRKDFIKQVELPIYPDTTVWIKDFEYSYNEPMHNDYFWHDAYSDYPVVGVTWDQATAFCNWRTKFKNDDQKGRGKQFVNKFRLPTEAEWEYAARGGIEGGMYPWGGPYVISDTGCYMANFKPQRGDYAADAALYTVEAKSFEPNEFNLYNMAGNVSEWTNSSFDPSTYDFVSTMNPNGGDSSNDRRVIRGGSWKDVAYFLQVSTRDYEYRDSARSYIGFRTVQDYMGEEDSTN